MPTHEPYFAKRRPRPYSRDCNVSSDKLTIELLPVSCNIFGRLEVSITQQQFVEPIHDTLCNLNDLVHPHVILSDGQVIGFFLIDTADLYLGVLQVRGIF